MGASIVTAPLREAGIDSVLVLVRVYFARSLAALVTSAAALARA